MPWFDSSEVVLIRCSLALDRLVEELVFGIIENYVAGCYLALHHAVIAVSFYTSWLSRGLRSATRTAWRCGPPVSAQVGVIAAWRALGLSSGSIPLSIAALAGAHCTRIHKFR